MNKKILSTIVAAALAVSPMAAFAENNDAVAIDVPATMEEVAAAPAFISATMTVASVADGEVVLKGDEDAEVNLTITADTLIIDTAGNRVEALKADDNITYFVKGNKPAPLVFPPVYTPDVVVVHAADGADMAAVKVDTFNIVDGTLLSSDGELIINADATVLENADGSKVTKASLEGKDLCVIYSMATMSIPAQTNPEKVYILPSWEEEAGLPVVEDEVIAEEAVAPEVTSRISANGGEAFDVTLIEINGRQMLPVRAVSEALGLEVGYSDELQAVTVGTVPMGVGFNIGVDSYTKSRMMPFVLSRAPIKVIFNETGVTYVQLMVT